MTFSYLWGVSAAHEQLVNFDQKIAHYLTIVKFKTPCNTSFCGVSTFWHDICYVMSLSSRVRGITSVQAIALMS